MQVAGIRVDQIPAVVVGAADDVLNRQVAVDRAHRVLRKQVAQPVMVKHPVQRGQVLVLHAVDAQRVIAHQLAQHPVLMQLFQVAVNLRLDVLFDFLRVRRDRRRLVELILQRCQHRTQDGAALFHGVRVQVAEHPHGLRVVDHVVPAAAVGLLAAQNIAQRQAVLPGTQPVELLGQLCAVLAKGIFAVERRLRVHAEHRRGVRPGGVVLQNRNAAVHLQKPLDVVLVFQTEIPAQEHRAVMLVGLRQQVQVAFPGGGGLRGLVHRAAHALGQQRGRPHGQQRQHKPCQQQPAGRGGRRAQRTAGQQRGKVRGVAPEQQPEHIHQLHRLPGHGQRRRQRGVGAQIRRPHQQCIDDQPPDFHAAQILEGIDEAPEEHHAVQLQRVIEQPAERKADLLQKIPQRHDQHQSQHQQQREHKVIPRRAVHRRTAQPQQPERNKPERHKPDVEEPIHDDRRQRKADAALHPAACVDRAEGIAQMERQHKVQRIAAGHAAQHLPAGRALINADELLPPQQAERMAHQHQQQGQQQKKCKHQPVILSDFNFRFSTAYSTAAAATAYPAINGVR